MNRFLSPLSRFFLKYMIAYLSVALIVLVFMIPIYAMAYTNTRQMMLQEYSSQLSKDFFDVSEALTKKNARLFFDMQNNSDIIMLSLSQQNNRKNTQYILSLREYMNSLLITDEMIDEVVIAFARNDYIVTSSRIFDRPALFYPNFMRYEGLTYDAWRNKIFTEADTVWRSSEISLDNQPLRNYMAINHYYPTQRNPSIVFSLLIDQEKIANRILIEGIAHNSFFYLANNHEIIFKHQYDGVYLDEIDNYDVITMDDQRDYTMLVMNDPEFRIKIVYGIPNDIFINDLRPVVSRAALYLMITIGAAIALSLAYTYAFYNPVKGLLGQLSRLGKKEQAFDSSGTNVYKYIQSALEEVNTQSDQMEKRYQEQRNMTDSIIFNMLLHGNPVRHNYITQFMHDQKAFRLSYLLLIVEIKSGKSTNDKMKEEILGQHVLEKLIDERFPGSYFYQGNPFCIVINVADHGGVSRIQTELSRVSRIVQSNMPELGIYFGLSKRHANITSIASAYDEAGYALQWVKMNESGSMMGYDDLPEKVDAISFGQFETLHNLLLTGNTEDVKQFFEKFLLSQMELSVNSYQTVSYTKVLNVIFRSVLARVKNTDSIEVYDYDPDSSPINILRMQKETAISIAEKINSSKKKQNDQLSQNIILFIKQNFANPDLSLTMIADQFMISDRYASQFIKDQLGINFKNFLEKLRIDKAKESLAETNLPVQDIASLVGYTNKNTFYKAFTRCCNMSPMAYRESAQFNLNDNQDA